VDPRLATPADAAAIAAVQVETWRDAYAGMIAAHVLDALTVEALTARWETYFGTPGVSVWVVGGVAGFVCVGPPRDADVTEGGEVYAIYVLPSAQRHGLGNALLSAAHAWLADRPGVLWTLTANAPARAFYEARGWAWDGTERGIDVGGDVVNEVRYRRETPAVRALT
jgi:GNAT superfamily N-acetyltransferase